MPSMITRIVYVVVFTFSLTATWALRSFAQSPPNFSPTPEADSLYAAGKWTEAAKAYEAVVEKDATHGRAWYRLGLSLQATGKYDEAVKALRRAVEIGNRPAVMYGLARALAMGGHKDESFAWLFKALNGGYTPAGSLASESDFAALREEPRFKEASALAERVARPCMFAAQHRQFDFWLGEWNVFNPAGEQVGTSSILNLAEGCAVFENWTNTQGKTGKSLNFYNRDKDKWQQTWVGFDGGVLEFAGEYLNGAMRYSTETTAKDGKKTLQKLTFFNLSPDRVRQLWEQSSDEGKTWTVVFDGLYVRRK
jgi:tetratricopeptide (TPR) repeat protein